MYVEQRHYGRLHIVRLTLCRIHDLQCCKDIQNIYFTVEDIVVGVL